MSKVRQTNVAIIGAGPVGLSMALSLARSGVCCEIYDKKTEPGRGSRAICFAQHTLEIFRQIGVLEPILKKGEVWQQAHTFLGDQHIHTIDYQANPNHRLAPYLNLQQSYLEEYLLEAAAKNPMINLQLGTAVEVQSVQSNSVTLELNQQETVQADYLVAADGVHSGVRKYLNLDFSGETFRDRFLIVDVKLPQDSKCERRFWFDPKFHEDKTVLMLKQPDDVWRIDFQLGWESDPNVEVEPERVQARLEKMLGHDNFEVEWVSIYTFKCRRMNAFSQGCVFFVGDAAHQVSPFGARGANSGIQDAHNLAWKLSAVLKDKAPETLLASYSEERVQAADDNIQQAAMSSQFISPATEHSRLLRAEVLKMSQEFDFAKALINNGRLSQPTIYPDSELSTRFDGETGVAVNQPLVDCSLKCKDDEKWLYDELGNEFSLIVYGRTNVSAALSQWLRERNIKLMFITSELGCCALHDHFGEFAEFYKAEPNKTFLVRPDHYVSAIWDELNFEGVKNAYEQALGKCISEMREAA